MDNEEGAKQKKGKGTIESNILRNEKDLVLGRRDPVLRMKRLVNPLTCETLNPDTSLWGPKNFKSHGV
jgi:hypothetical protein